MTPQERRKRYIDALVAAAPPISAAQVELLRSIDRDQRENPVGTP
jgi:hypothetical protein